MALRWFDGHLDLAFLAEQGRDLGKTPEDCGGLLQPAAVTLGSLVAGNVQGALATIFIQRRVSAEMAGRQKQQAVEGPWCFETLAEAGEAARRQLEIYARWHREGKVRLVTEVPLAKHVQREEKPGARSQKPVVNEEEQDGHAQRGPYPAGHGTPALVVAILMEGAAGLERVEELDEFYAGGVRVMSLTWGEGTIWAGGDHWGGDVTSMGRELIGRADELGILHDVSHLSERAFWTVMEVGKRIKVASHSNCRALSAPRYPERLLTDDQIRALVQGGGIIGLNLYGPFLAPPGGGRATIADVLRHIAHMEDVAGRRDFLCLGSDMDGAFSAAKLPVDLDRPEHLGRLAEALSKAGWSDGEIEGFAWGNWGRVLRTVGVRTT